MMQLLCNGTFLDLYEGSGLQFTHKNPLFAFDALECERTTSFKLPATPKNDRVLALAKLPALSGVAMRRKYDAELYDGTVVKKGYIYVSNFDGKDYNAIFVTGELVGLQALKNAGKIRDLLVFDQAVTWDNTNTHTADEATLPDIGFVQYERDPSTAHLNASISLRWLMEQIATKTGVTINYLNAASDERWRLLAAGADIYNLNDLAVHLENIANNNILLRRILGITIGYGAGAYIADCFAVRDERYLRWASQQPTLQQFEMLKFAYEIVLEFPEDFPDDYFIMSNGYWSMSGTTWYNEEICNMYRPSGDEYYVFGPYGRCANFLGDYSFDWNGTVHGAPLAGRKVTIPANTPFALLPKSALVYREPEAVGDTATIGYDASAVPAYDYEVRISINHDFVYGEDVPLNAMLPEFTAVELLKLYAAINGCVLNYTDAQGVTFESLDFDNYAMRDIKALTKRGELVRTFSDYAQQNIVKMTPEDWVWLGERIKTQYAIDNDNIEAEKDLLVLKASEGGKKIAYTDTGEVHTRLLVRNDAEGKRKAKDQTIALASVDDPNMLRVTIPTIEGLQNLCTASTQQKISARMTLLEYNAIQAKTLALVEGLRYIWTDRSWQKNEAQFTLARLYEASAAPVPPPIPPGPQPIDYTETVQQELLVGTTQSFAEAFIPGFTDTNDYNLYIVRFDNNTGRANALLFQREPSIFGNSNSFICMGAWRDGWTPVFIESSRDVTLSAGAIVKVWKYPSIPYGLFPSGDPVVEPNDYTELVVETANSWNAGMLAQAYIPGYTDTNDYNLYIVRFDNNTGRSNALIYQRGLNGISNRQFVLSAYFRDNWYVYPISSYWDGSLSAGTIVKIWKYDGAPYGLLPA